MFLLTISRLLNGMTPACWCYLVAAVPIQRPVGLQEKERKPLFMLFDLVTDNLEEVVSFLK